MAATVIGNAQAHVKQQLRVKSLGYRCLIEVVVALAGVAEAEFLDRRIVEATFLEVTEADFLTGLCLVELALKITASPLVEHEHRLALGLGLFFLIGEFFFLDFDVVFAGQVPQSLGIAELLVFHDEIDRTAALAAGKALADALSARDVERGPAVIVERTQADPVGAPSLETHEVAHHVHDVGRVENLLYCIVVNHLDASILYYCLCRRSHTTSGIKAWSTVDTP